MAIATTYARGKLLIEVETDPVGAAGTYIGLCGIKDASVSIQWSTEEDEIPDCSDPDELHRVIYKKAKSMTVSGSGYYATESSEFMKRWAHELPSYRVRVRDVLAEASGATGDITAETFMADLTQFDRATSDGKKWTADITISSTGEVTLTEKA
jgi:hypothetical protein